MICFDNNNNNKVNRNEHILLITMLTIKILFTINSLKKTILSKYYVRFLLSKKNQLILIRKNSFKKKVFSRSIAFLIRKSLKRGKLNSILNVLFTV